MKNLKGSADRLTLTAPSGGVVAGTMYAIGDGIVVVAEATAAVGQLFSGIRRGEITYAKVGGTSITAGDRAFWNSSTNVVTPTSASGLFPIGSFTADAASGDATASVQLDGVYAAAVV